MAANILPMTLGDIFDRVFKLFGKTVSRSAIVAVIVMAPAVLLLAFGCEAFVSTFLGMAKESQRAATMDMGQAMAIMKAVAIFAVALLVYAVSTLVVTLGIILLACREMTGERMTWQEALTLAFGVRFIRQLGQAILMYLALGAVFILPYLVLIGGAAAKSTGVTLAGVLLIMAAMGAVFFLWIRWAFASVAIAWEEAGVLQSFRRSASLVKGYWWRTFGILLLLLLAVQFAISIITTPLSLFAMRDFFPQYVSFLSSAGSGAQDPGAMLEAFDSFGLGMGLLAGVSSILSMLVIPLIFTVMYFDLRARQGELSTPATQLP